MRGEKVRKEKEGKWGVSLFKIDMDVFSSFPSLTDFKVKEMTHPYHSANDFMPGNTSGMRGDSYRLSKVEREY